MAAQLTPHEAMVAWGEAASKFLALEAEIKATYNGKFDDDELLSRDAAAWIQMEEAWRAAKAAYQAAGQTAAVRMLEEFTLFGHWDSDDDGRADRGEPEHLPPFGYGDEAELEHLIDSVLALPTDSRPGTHETPAT